MCKGGPAHDKVVALYVQMLVIDAHAPETKRAKRWLDVEPACSGEDVRIVRNNLENMKRNARA